jgi:hypothetical protein
MLFISVSKRKAYGRGPKGSTSPFLNLVAAPWYTAVFGFASRLAAGARSGLLVLDNKY